MNYKAICSIICSLEIAIPSAHAVEICGDLKQGELVLIKDTNAKTMTLYNGVGINKLSDADFKPKNKRNYKVTPDGVALLAFHR